MMKEKFENAEIDVLVLETEDIITTSDPFSPDTYEGSLVGG